MIRPALIAWRKATRGLIQASETVDEDTRDQTIESIDMLLEVRNKLQPEITGPFTPEEDALGIELLILEEDLALKIASFNKRIHNEILQSQSKKDHMKSYVNPYSKVAKDGLYYDTKK